jgi:hypothetical protein
MVCRNGGRFLDVHDFHLAYISFDNSKINIPFHSQGIHHFIIHINPKKGIFQHQLMVNDNIAQTFWMFKFVQIQNFLQGVYDVGSIHKMHG